MIKKFGKLGILLVFSAFFNHTVNAVADIPEDLSKIDDNNRNVLMNMMGLDEEAIKNLKQDEVWVQSPNVTVGNLTLKAFIDNISLADMNADLPLVDKSVQKATTIYFVPAIEMSDKRNIISSQKNFADEYYTGNMERYNQFVPTLIRSKEAGIQFMLPFEVTDYTPLQPINPNEKSWGIEYNLYRSMHLKANKITPEMNTVRKNVHRLILSKEEYKIINGGHTKRQDMRLWGDIKRKNLTKNKFLEVYHDKLKLLERDGKFTLRDGNSFSYNEFVGQWGYATDNYGEQEKYIFDLDIMDLEQPEIYYNFMSVSPDPSYMGAISYALGNVVVPSFKIYKNDIEPISLKVAPAETRNNSQTRIISKVKSNKPFDIFAEALKEFKTQDSKPLAQRKYIDGVFAYYDDYKKGFVIYGYDHSKNSKFVEYRGLIDGEIISSIVYYSTNNDIMMRQTEGIDFENALNFATDIKA